MQRAFFLIGFDLPTASWKKFGTFGTDCSAVLTNKVFPKNHVCLVCSCKMLLVCTPLSTIVFLAGFNPETCLFSFSSTIHAKLKKFVGYIYFSNRNCYFSYVLRRVSLHLFQLRLLLQTVFTFCQRRVLGSAMWSESWKKSGTRCPCFWVMSVPTKRRSTLCVCVCTNIVAIYVQEWSPTDPYGSNITSANFYLFFLL